MKRFETILEKIWNWRAFGGWHLMSRNWVRIIENLIWHLTLARHSAPLPTDGLPPIRARASQAGCHYYSSFREFCLILLIWRSAFSHTLPSCCLLIQCNVLHPVRCCSLSKESPMAGVYSEIPSAACVPDQIADRESGPARRSHVVVTMMAVVVCHSACAAYGARTSPTESGVRYRVTDIGTAGRAASLAYGINNRGEVVGETRETEMGSPHAFLWKKGNMRELFRGNAHRINDRGQIVGEGRHWGKRHAFLLTPRRLR